MLPEFSFFGSEMSTYGFCAAIGLVMMGITAFILGRRYKILLEDILFGEIFMLIGAFLGAHLLYGITNISNIVYYLGLYFSEGWDKHYFFDIIFKFMDGMVFYGGLLTAIGFSRIALLWVYRCFIALQGSAVSLRAAATVLKVPLVLQLPTELSRAETM